MAKQKKPAADEALDHDQKIQKPSNYLETQKEHKDWYDIHKMGRQRGRPRLVPREEKKSRGIKKHSLRKER